MVEMKNKGTISIAQHNTDTMVSKPSTTEGGFIMLLPCQAFNPLKGTESKSSA